MKIGTDGVLLGAWAPISHPNRILDIGTGTGVIAIMLAQRTTSEVRIDAIEIDENAYQQALENVANCKWTNRVSPYFTSLQEFTKDNSSQKYDLIVSNPPFFTNGSKPLETNRTNARHVDTLSHEELINCSRSLLSDEGILSIILPATEGKRFIQMAETEKLYCKHQVEVRPKIDKPVERLLLNFSKQRPSAISQDNLTIQFEERNDYTPKYIALTKEFYSIM